jgi:DNA-binding protein
MLPDPPLARIAVKWNSLIAAGNPRLNMAGPNGYVEMSEENVVYIGSKPVMNYCLAVLTSLQSKGSNVALKARGRAISTAVDVAEVTRTRFMKDLSVEKIEIGTEEMKSMEGQTRNVSTITIVLKKE